MSRCRALIDCFPDEDSHLTKSCLNHSKAMTVGEILTLLDVPFLHTRKERERALCEYMSMSMCARNRTFNIRKLLIP